MANDIGDCIEALSRFLDIDNVQCEIGKLEQTMSAPDFWQNQLLAIETVAIARL
jgi:hypothetical protein